MRPPQSLFASGGKAGESAILDFVAAQPPAASKWGRIVLPRESIRMRPASRGMKRWVGLGVIADNLTNIARALIAKIDTT
jgi:hypothetical protein